MTDNWRKRRTFEDQSIDFETMEELFEEVLELFEESEVDFSKPLKMAFSVSLDEKGNLRINEFGLLKEKKFGSQKSEEPFVELIEFDNEFLIVVEANSLPPKDIDIKVLDHALIISDNSNNKFLKKISFPSKVKETSIRTKINNNVLEIRIAKKAKTSTAVKR
ncbi:MAG: Hsp20/alpha crystallin family protein [archaeon]|nr:Hsp20/alpha crystallin family protein [archaeon]